MKQSDTTEYGDKTILVDRYFAPTLLIGSILLLQYHSIEFWTEHVGPLGWGWSILLEAGALYLWYRHDTGLRIIGFFVSAMLLAGPLYTVAEPLLEKNHSESQTAEQRENRAGLLRNEIDELERRLNTYLENSKKRIGWSSRIDETSEKIDQRKEELRQVMSTQDAVDMNWTRQAVIVMQAIALLLYQFFSVLAVTTLSRRHAEQYVKEEKDLHIEDIKGAGHSISHMDLPVVSETTRKLSPHEQGVDQELTQQDNLDQLPDNTRKLTLAFPYNEGGNFVNRQTITASQEVSDSQEKKVVEANVDDEFSLEVVAQISQALTGHLERQDITQKEFAIQHGYTPSDISRIKNHAEYLRNGRRTASNAAIRKLGIQLGVI